MGIKVDLLQQHQLPRVLELIAASATQELRDEKIGLLLVDLLMAKRSWTVKTVVDLLTGVHGAAHAESALKCMTAGCKRHVPLSPMGDEGPMPFAYWCLEFNRVDALESVATMGLTFPRESETQSTTDAGEALDQMSCISAAPVLADPGDPLSSKPGTRWSFISVLDLGPDDTGDGWTAELLDSCADLLARLDPQHGDFHAVVAKGTELGARFAKAAMAQHLVSHHKQPVPELPARRRAIGA